MIGDMVSGNTSRRARNMYDKSLAVRHPEFDPKFRPRARNGLISPEASDDLRLAAEYAERRTSLNLWKNHLPDTVSQLDQASDYNYGSDRSSRVG